HSRAYSLTPRAAMLGSMVQPGLVRDGRLIRLMDRLVAQTGLGVAVFGMVGLKAQLCTWRGGKQALRTVGAAGLHGGQPEHLLLPAGARPPRDGLVRRMNAEASPERRFAFATMSARIDAAREQGFASGEAGFGCMAEVTAVLLPGLPDDQPLAIGFMYEPSSQ